MSDALQTLVYGPDRTPRVSIWLDDDEQYFVEEYSISNDVLNLGDPFRLKIPNIDGRNAGRYRPGSLCRVYMEDPALGGSMPQSVFKGRVTSLEYQSDARSGSSLMVGGADLGWHLNNTCAPMWLVLKGMKFSTLVASIIDPAWGIAAVGYGNAVNKTIRQGRADAQAALAKKRRQEQVNAAIRQAEAEAAAAGEASLNLGSTGVQNRIAQLSDFGGYVPPLQVEPGQMCADLLIEFARREGWLVNVSADGVLQFFEPFNGPDVDYSIRYYKATSPNRNQNNVKSAKLTKSIDGLYTKVVCVATKVMPDEFLNPEDQNANRERGTYTDTSVLPFPRFFSFADGDQYTKGMATRRAEWRFKRGLFDSTVIEYTVKGHSQNGIFWVPDTLVDVIDEVHGLKGNYYLSAVRYDRSMSDGTTTTLTLHEAGQLSA